jgi:hypothetical protein
MDAGLGLQELWQSLSSRRAFGDRDIHQLLFGAYLSRIATCAGTSARLERFT